MEKLVLTLVLSLLTIQSLAAKQIRSEINRYRLMKDRQLSEKALIKEEHNSFLSLDANISSGLKELIGDISDSSSQVATSNQVAGITEVLSRNINTERLIGVDLELGIPLPYLQLTSWAFLPTLFYTFEMGSSVSINNQDSVTSPKAQLYVQKSTTFGVHSKLRNKNVEDETWAFSIYQRHRSDLVATRSALEISDGDGLIDLDELNQDESIYAFDLSFFKDKQSYRYLIEIKELKLFDANSVIRTSMGNSPFFHFLYEKDYFVREFKLSALFGVHHRKKYGLTDSLYVGAKLRVKEGSPLLFVAKVDSQFMSYNMGLTFRHFHFHYGFKTPFRNPQEEMWVSSIHQISLNLPF